MLAVFVPWATVARQDFTAIADHSNKRKTDLLIAEPTPTRYDLHFKVLGFPVRVHPFFWLMAVMLGINGRDTRPYQVAIWILVVFVSILVHELGHALAIRRFGWGSRIILYHLGGLATLESPDSYLPAHNENEHKPGVKILIALAGPAAGFLLAGVVIAVLFAARVDFGFVRSQSYGIIWDLQGLYDKNERLGVLVDFLLYVNVFWGLLNLLPVYPLDGGQVARELFSLKNPRAGIENSLLLSSVTGGIVAGLSLFHFGFPDGLFMAVMFGVLSFVSFRTLQQFRQHPGYGGGGGIGGQRGYDEDDDDWWKRG